MALCSSLVNILSHWKIDGASFYLYMSVGIYFWISTVTLSSMGVVTDESRPWASAWAWWRPGGGLLLDVVPEALLLPCEPRREPRNRRPAADTAYAHTRHGRAVLGLSQAEREAWHSFAGFADDGLCVRFVRACVICFFYSTCNYL